ncbi:S1C family serine protease [Shumkonia mesophila]|uniref:S1C family serine protease n=1 Tax=Shumkonia mesophila TaxID=2838854 RepID=UPI002934D3EA|nr:serine protease [Shumkonia mesophila]
MRQVLGVLAVALGLAACSVTEPVIGLVGNAGERYDGTATGYMDRTGTITMANTTGGLCTGGFHYTGAKIGVGTLTCNDGRRATIQFQAITSLSGFGYGVTDDGEPIRFTYGLSEEQSRPHLVAPASGPRAPVAVSQEGDRPRASSGTGFVVSEDGKVLTNHHVAGNCKRVTVRRVGSEEFPGTVVASDAANDLALLMVRGLPGPAAKFRSGRAVRAGEEIVVFGFPYSGALSSGGSLTNGSISALTGLRDDSRMFQISAPVQAGNSGGPLLDNTGLVVGIIRSKLDALHVAGITGDIPQNVNFAIKTSTVQSFLDANGIVYGLAAPGKAMSVADVGDQARQFTVFIRCVE